MPGQLVRATSKVKAKRWWPFRTPKKTYRGFWVVQKNALWKVCWFFFFDFAPLSGKSDIWAPAWAKNHDADLWGPYFTNFGEFFGIFWPLETFFWNATAFTFFMARTKAPTRCPMLRLNKWRQLRYRAAKLPQISVWRDTNAWTVQGSNEVSHAQVK